MMSGMVAATGVAAVLAHVINGHALTAAVGGGLVVLYWGLERLFAVLGQRGSFARGLCVGLAGMAVRLTVVVGCLVVVGLVDREGFAACSVAFLAVFTLHLAVSTTLLAVHPSR